MNLPLVFRVVSVLALIVAAILIIPAVVALMYGETDAFRSFAAVMLPTGVISGVFVYASRNAKPTLSSHDGYLLVTAAWLTVSFIGALPFVISGAIPSYTDAFFETMSGFTTTGASILTDIESLPKSILFWRSRTHWLGGMGIIVLAVAVFPLLGFKGLQLVKAEAPWPTVDKVTPKIAQTAKLLWSIYLGMTVLETVLLLFAGMDLFDAITHTFGTLATGGFSPRNASVAAYNSAAVDIIITIFMMLAGVNFVLYFNLFTGRFRTVVHDTEVKVYLSIFAVATIITTFSLFGSRFPTIGESLRYAAFQVASILTTTGFATDDFNAWPGTATGVLFVLMFVGGCAGSTGGGIKVVRLVTLFKQGINEMKYLLHPRGVFNPRLNKAPLRKNIVFGISAFVFLYLAIIMVTTLVVSFTGASLVTSLTTALVTLGNIGPGFDAVGPTANYAFFPPILKWFLSLVMMTGRLEVYTVVILLTPMYWKR